MAEEQDYLTVEEINAAPSLKWDALIEWSDKIDAKADAINAEYRRWQAAEQKMLTS
jgi:hypothetical protein